MRDILSTQSLHKSSAITNHLLGAVIPGRTYLAVVTLVNVDVESGQTNSSFLDIGMLSGIAVDIFTLTISSRVVGTSIGQLTLVGCALVMSVA